MKKTVEFTIENKTYELMFNIKSLALLEKRIGKSITYLFASGPEEFLKQFDMTITANCLFYALQLNDIDEAYDIIQNFCDVGGSVDDLNAKLVEAIMVTGLFTRGVVQAKEETAPKVKTKKTK